MTVQLFPFRRISTKMYSLHLKFDLILLKILILKAKLENSVDSTALSSMSNLWKQLHVTPKGCLQPFQYFILNLQLKNSVCSNVLSSLCYLWQHLHIDFKLLNSLFWNQNQIILLQYSSFFSVRFVTNFTHCTLTLSFWILYFETKTK